MTSTRKPRILLFGTGSVGTVYAYLLSKSASVTAVCRSNYDIVKQNGFTLNSAIFGQNLHFNLDVVRDCAEAAAAHAHPFDYILICSKAIPGTIPNIIAPALTPNHTVLVLAQNGIGIEAEYAEAFPSNPLVSGVLYLPATQRPAGVVKHGEIEKLELGSYPSTASPKHAQAFANLIRAGGGTANVFDDIQVQRWAKLIVNASWNPVCALTLCTDVDFMVSLPEATELVRAIMLEVCGIAAAYGYTIAVEQVDFQLARATARIRKEQPVEPSMMQDVRGGRKMEVEAILGNTVKLGRAKGVTSEKLEFLYMLTKALDSQVGKAKRP